MSDKIIQALADIKNLVTQGKDLEAMEKYYADNIVKVELDGTETHGKENCIRYIQEYYSHCEIKSMEHLGDFLHGNISVTVSWWHMIHDQRGEMKFKEVSVTEWNDEGKIISEKYFREVS